MSSGGGPATRRGEPATCVVLRARKRFGGGCSVRVESRLAMVGGATATSRQPHAPPAAARPGSVADPLASARRDGDAACPVDLEEHARVQQIRDPRHDLVYPRVDHLASVAHEHVASVEGMLDPTLPLTRVGAALLFAAEAVDGDVRDVRGHDAFGDAVHVPYLHSF